jgi:hypothetical protein
MSVSLEAFAQEAITNNELFVGSRQAGAEVLDASVTATTAVDTNNRIISAKPCLFATRNPNVGIFAGSVWSRDGWSGWFSYNTEELVEFFGAPFILAQALQTHGTLYRVPASYFKPGIIPGEYVSTTTSVPVCAQRSVNILDMSARILASTLIIPDLERARRVAKLPPHNEARLRTIGATALDPRQEWPDGNALVRSLKSNSRGT